MLDVEERRQGGECQTGCSNDEKAEEIIKKITAFSYCLIVLLEQLCDVVEFVGAKNCNNDPDYGGNGTETDDKRKQANAGRVCAFVLAELHRAQAVLQYLIKLQKNTAGRVCWDVPLVSRR